MLIGLGRAHRTQHEANLVYLGPANVTSWTCIFPQGKRDEIQHYSTATHAPESSFLERQFASYQHHTSRVHTGSTCHRDLLSSIRNINQRSTLFVTFSPTFSDSTQRDEKSKKHPTTIQFQRYPTLNTYRPRRIPLNIEEASSVSRLVQGRLKVHFSLSLLLVSVDEQC